MTDWLTLDAENTRAERARAWAWAAIIVGMALIGAGWIWIIARMLG